MASYLDLVHKNLPDELSQRFRSLTGSISPADQDLLENVVRFIIGAGPIGWAENYMHLHSDFTLLSQRPTELKRKDESNDTPSTKKSKSREDARMTLHSISASSPFRKKMDLTVYQTSIEIRKPSSDETEASLPLSAIQYAFLLPTRGKAKPHWTVILLPSASIEEGNDSVPQLVFGIEATTSSTFSTTTYLPNASPILQVSPKGSETLPLIRKFLSFLPIPLIEPSLDVFRSQISSSLPGVEAYRAAKPGTLYFLREGLLWTDSRPIEFWPLNTLVGSEYGLRLLSVTGRTCTVIVSRKDPIDEGMGEEMAGIETEFAMVDGKEQDVIKAWRDAHKHLFGHHGNQASMLHTEDDDTDPDDASFELDSEDYDGGSASSSSSSDGDEDHSGAEIEEVGDNGAIQSDTQGSPSTTKGPSATNKDEEDELDDE
jgi:hypothetical protein